MGTFVAMSAAKADPELRYQSGDKMDPTDDELDQL